MNRKILKALKGSIKKWEDIVDETGIDDGSDNCPLCEVCRYTCDGCPIRIKKKVTCSSTPYGEWKTHHYYKHDKEDLPLKVECPECEKLAKKELKFLKSFLPKRRKSNDRKTSNKRN